MYFKFAKLSLTFLLFSILTKFVLFAIISCPINCVYVCCLRNY